MSLFAAPNEAEKIDMLTLSGEYDMNNRPKELCQLAANWTGTTPDAGITAEEKRNGWRALYFRGFDGKPRLWTRNGHRIEGAAHIIHRLGLFEQVAGQHLFIDGEFQVGGTLAATKHWCETGWKEGGNKGELFAFDIVPLDRWRRGGWDTPQIERKAWLQDLAAQVASDTSLSWDWRPQSRGADEDCNPVTVLPDDWAFDARGVVDLANRVWARDGEGLMLKDPAAPYRRNRSDAWQKVKPGGAWMNKLSRAA